MPNDHFAFKQFTIWQSSCSQKVSTDACIFGAWVAHHAGPAARILDIGAGTGLLMLMLAQKHGAGIDGIELDPACYAQMMENMSKSPWRDRLRGMEGDVKAAVLPAGYDLVISNPPFYENQLGSPNEQKNLAWHSSKLSLEELLTTATGLMDARGAFAAIVPYGRKDELDALAGKMGLLPRRTLSVRHTLNHPFTRYMSIYARHEATCNDEWLDIKTVDGNYSEQMIALLQDYYLFL